MAGITITLIFAFHILSGAVAMTSGVLALCVRKGARIHRASGNVFVIAMVVMAVSAGVLGAVRPGQTINIFIAGLTLYLVATAWLTARRREKAAGAPEIIALIVSLLLCAPFALIDFQIATGVTLFKAAFKIEGPILIALCVFSAIMATAALGDLRVVLSRGVSGTARIARHLWRMCFALALTFGSAFTNGFARLLPGPYHVPPAFFLPQLLMLLVLVYWVVRVRMPRLVAFKSGAGMRDLCALIGAAAFMLGGMAHAAWADELLSSRIVPAPKGAPAPTDPDGTVHMPPVDVPFSSFASPEARQAFVAGVERARRQMANPAKDVATIRRQADAALGVLLAESRKSYPVDIQAREIGSVYTDDVMPQDGVSPQNRNRVLIELHGGGFFSGARTCGKVEAVPVAAVGKIRVLAVDYREGPENKFPAASEDVASVYRALLKQYPAKNIGIYGCSAGGMLTTEVVAWLEKQGLPPPGAIGVFCASASGWAGGDSTYVVSSNGRSASPTNSPHFAVSNAAYFDGVDLNDPLVTPIRSPEVMAKFPPTLMITGTRDVSMSSAVHTHAELVKLGVDADLHVWEGMGHGFFYDSTLPESREAYAVIATFFDRHLGR